MGEIVVGIDIGTSKVCVLIGKMNKAGQMEILGKGMSPCSGVKKGVIIDIDNTASSIRRAVEIAEADANVKVVSGFANIIGAHVSVINNRSSVDIPSENREITGRDVEKLLYSVKDLSIPMDRQVIDIIPRQYIVDGYDEIVDPIGMVGLKVELDADVIAGKVTSVQNIVRSLERANIKTDGIVVESLAAAEMALTAEEKEMGVVLIDVGGGVTDISYYKNKKLLFYDSLPVGGDHITNDIAMGLKISNAEAEKIKRQYELALTSLIKNDQEITVMDISDDRRKSVKISEVVDIIEARVYEIFLLSKEMLEKANISFDTGIGVVLTGGGISYVDGGIQLSSEVFGISARIATYRSAGISQVEYATAAGIVKYISNVKRLGGRASEVRIIKAKPQEREYSFFAKLSQLLKKLF